MSRTKVKPIVLALAWRKNYLDPDSPAYLDGFKSAQLAYDPDGSKGLSIYSLQGFSRHCQKRFKKSIDIHIKDTYLNPAKVLDKLHDLTEAKKTLYFQKDGMVTDEREIEALDIQYKAASKLADLTLVSADRQAPAQPSTLVQVNTHISGISDAQLMERIQGLLPNVIGQQPLLYNGEAVSGKDTD